MNAEEIAAIRAELQRAKAAQMANQMGQAKTEKETRPVLEVISDSHKDYYTHGKNKNYLVGFEDSRVSGTLDLAQQYKNLTNEYLAQVSSKLGEPLLAEDLRQILVDQYILYVLIPTKKLFSLLELFDDTIHSKINLANYYLRWTESVQAPYRTDVSDAPDEVRKYQRQFGPNYESTTQQQLDLYKMSGSEAAYVAALKVMTARSLVNQIYYHQNIVLNRNEDVVIPKGCQSPALSSRGGVFKTEPVAPEQRTEILNGLIDTMGVAIRFDEIENPQGANQVGQQASEMKKLYDVNVSFGSAGVGTYNPYSATPFEKFRAAQFGLASDKRDQRLEPAIDDFSEFMSVHEIMTSPQVGGRAYPAGFEPQKYLGISGIIKKLFQVKADKAYCEGGPCSEGETPYLVLSKWPAYLVELLGDDPKPYLTNGYPDPEKFVCSGAKDLLKTFVLRMPAPRMWGSPNYRDWALKTLSRSLHEYLNSSQPEVEYAGLSRMISRSEFCSEWRKLNGKSSCGDEKQELAGLRGPLTQVLNAMNGGGVGYFDQGQFTVLNENVQIDDLKRYELVIRNLWHSVAQYVSKRKEAGLWTNADGSVREDDYSLREWDYITENFGSGANPWVYHRLAFVRAFVCDPDLRNERNKSDLKVHPLRFMGDVLKYTSSDAACSPSQMAYLQQTPFYSKLKTKTDFKEYCSLNNPVGPYHANKVLNDSEKKKVWEQTVKSDLEINREAFKSYGGKTVEALSSFSSTYYGLNPGESKNGRTTESGLDLIERIFREPLIFSESDYQSARKKLFKSRERNWGDYGNFVEKPMSQEPFLTALKTTQYYRDVYLSRNSDESKVEKFLKLKSEAARDNLEDYDIEQRDLRNDVVRVDQIYKRALYVEAIQFQSVKNLSAAKESLVELCKLSPMRSDQSNEDFRRLVLATLNSQNALNQSWGLEAAPASIMEMVSDYKYPWELQGYFMGGFLAMSLLSAGCTVMSFGLCLVPLAAAAAGVTAWAQTEMVVYIWDQMRDTEEREKFLQTYIELGTSNKDAYNFTGNEGWGTLSLELVMGVPVVGGLSRFGGQLGRSLEQVSSAYRVARLQGRGILGSSAKTARQGFKALFSSQAGRLSEAGSGLYYLGLITRAQSFDSAVVQKTLANIASGNEKLVFENFAREVSTRFGGSHTRFIKFLDKYTDKKFLETAEKDLAMLGQNSQKLGFANRILTLGGVSGLRSMIQNRAARKLISGQKISSLNQRILQSQRSGATLEEFVTQNAEEMYLLFNSMAYRGRDIFYEALFQGPVTSSILENSAKVATVGLGNMYRASPLQGMIDFSQLRRLSHSVGHVLLESRRIRAQQVLGLPAEVSHNPKTFELVKKFSDTVESLAVVPGKTGTLSQSQLDEITKSFDAFKNRSASRMLEYWEKTMDSGAKNPGGIGAQRWDYLKGLVKGPDPLGEMKKLLFEADRLGTVSGNMLDRVEIARALWNGTPQKVVFGEVSELGLSAEQVLKYTMDYKSLDEFEFYKSAFDVLRMKGRLEGQKY
jgi:hypothetical protein